MMTLPLLFPVIEGRPSSRIPVPDLQTPNYALPALGTWRKVESKVYFEAQEAAEHCYSNECFRCIKILSGKTVISDPDRRK